MDTPDLATHLAGGPTPEIMGARTGAEAEHPSRRDPDAPRSFRPFRFVADGAQLICIKLTGWTDHAPPLKQPTESQKLRANVIGSVLAAGVLGLIIFRIERGTEREAAERAEDHAVAMADRQTNALRFAARNDAIKSFADRFPRSLLLSMRMVEALVQYAQRPADWQDLPGSEHDRWLAVKAGLDTSRNALSEWGDAAGPCLILEANLATQPARDAVGTLRTAVTAMLDLYDAEAYDAEVIRINALWDAAIEAVAQEIRSETKAPQSRRAPLDRPRPLPSRM